MGTKTCVCLSFMHNLCVLFSDTHLSATPQPHHRCMSGQNCRKKKPICWVCVCMCLCVCGCQGPQRSHYPGHVDQCVYTWLQTEKSFLLIDLPERGLWKYTYWFGEVSLYYLSLFLQCTPFPDSSAHSPSTFFFLLSHFFLSPKSFH